jgi:hypothetical protein
MAVAQARIGWCWFMEGMISTHFVEVQYTYQMLCGLGDHIDVDYAWAVVVLQCGGA